MLQTTIRHQITGDPHTAGGLVAAGTAAESRETAQQAAFAQACTRNIDTNWAHLRPFHGLGVPSRGPLAIKRS